MPADPLVVVYNKEGRRFADALRRLLPIIMQGSMAGGAVDLAKAQRARAQLQAIANSTSLRLKASSAAWLRVEMPKLVEAGQRRGASQIRVRFGGVNRQLIERLALELAPRLATAAESVNPYLAMALRRTTVLAIQRDDRLVDQALGGAGTDRAINKSLLEGTVKRDTLRQATARLMEDLGLDRGDSVLLLSGRKLQALDYAKTVTRTRRAEAANLGAAHEYLQHGYQFIKTSAHDGVDPKDICYFLQGKVWALVPNEYGIPLLPFKYGLPPWHPNCVHTIAPWIPALNGGAEGIKAVLRSHEGDAEALLAWDGSTKK